MLIQELKKMKCCRPSASGGPGFHHGAGSRRPIYLRLSSMPGGCAWTHAPLVRLLSRSTSAGPPRRKNGRASPRRARAPARPQQAPSPHPSACAQSRSTQHIFTHFVLRCRRLVACRWSASGAGARAAWAWLGLGRAPRPQHATRSVERGISPRCSTLSRLHSDPHRVTPVVRATTQYVLHVVLRRTRV